MNESDFHDAKSELKRAEHLLYVSLKYTRTVDVIKSIIDRLISGIEIMIDKMLEYAKVKRKIKEIPASVTIKCDTVKKVFDDEKMIDFINFYLMLRKIQKAKYKRSSEYRKHVTMTALVEDTIININLEVIKEYYEKAVAFLEFAEELTGVKKPA